MGNQQRRRLSGKVSWVMIAAILGVVILGVVLFAGGESPETAAARFMSGLVDGDAKVLAENSYVPGVSDEELLKKWEETVERGKYYKFAWAPKGNIQDAPDQVKVSLDVVRNLSPAAYEERFTLVVKKHEGKWKVLANTVSREMYPFLPRF